MKISKKALKRIILEEKAKIRRAARRRNGWKKIIVKECPGGMMDDPPMVDANPSADAQMDLAPAPDLPDAHGHAEGGMPCPVKTAAKMKDAGASEAELMDFVNTLIDEFRSGGTTVPERPEAQAPAGDIVGDLLGVLGL